MNLKDTLSKFYPEGSIGGECGSWCHNWVNFSSIGDSYAQKKKFIQLNGIIATNINEIGKGYRIGDIIVTSEGTFMGFGNGHVAFIIDQDSDSIYLGESNFRKDQRVHYGRKLAKNDPKIYGIGRFPFKLDLGPLEIDYNVFVNNFSKDWGTKWLEDTAKLAPFKINFFPLGTAFQNWDYKVYDQNYKVISKEYIEANVMPLAYTSDHKPSNAVALFINPTQWQGSSLTGDREIAYYHASTNPAEIQASCDEFEISPWYATLRLSQHVLLHELAHYLYYLNGLDDYTHNFDNLTARNLQQVFSELDFNRIKANL